MNTYDYSQQSEDFQRIEKAIQFIEKNFKSQPTLDQMAKSVYLSKYHTFEAMTPGEFKKHGAGLQI